MGLEEEGTAGSNIRCAEVSALSDVMLPLTDLSEHVTQQSSLAARFTELCMKRMLDHVP